VAYEALTRGKMKFGGTSKVEAKVTSPPDLALAWLDAGLLREDQAVSTSIETMMAAELPRRIARALGGPV